MEEGDRQAPPSNLEKSKLATRPFAATKTPWKRTFDLTGSVLLLLFLFPTFAFLTVAMFVSSPGAPIFFRQVRVGKDGVTFSCLKFRTMCTNADFVLHELLSRDPWHAPNGRGRTS